MNITLIILKKLENGSQKFCCNLHSPHKNVFRILSESDTLKPLHIKRLLCFLHSSSEGYRSPEENQTNRQHSKSERYTKRCGKDEI
jgi:hypothetical protein